MFGKYYSDCITECLTTSSLFFKTTRKVFSEIYLFNCLYIFLMGRNLSASLLFFTIIGTDNTHISIANSQASKAFTFWRNYPKSWLPNTNVATGPWIPFSKVSKMRWRYRAGRLRKTKGCSTFARPVLADFTLSQPRFSLKRVTETWRKWMLIQSETLWPTGIVNWSPHNTTKFLVLATEKSASGWSPT